MKLLFDPNEGAGFVIGRIPMGASDYAIERHTYDETAGDTALTNFSISRDMTTLIPYVKAAQAVNGSIRMWASPWTPPTWMKTTSGSVNGTSCANMGGNAYNGGCMNNVAANLTAYAQYFVKFVAAYKAQNINIEMVAPQNEPNYSQGYPSALWDSTLYTKFVKTYLGPALNGMNVKIMLGTMSNGDNGAQSKDLMVVQNAMGDATAKPLFKAIGLQWGMLDLYKADARRCSTRTTSRSGRPSTSAATTPGTRRVPRLQGAAPNDQAYAVESWDYIRDAIKAGVTAYNAWNMVLDTVGQGERYGPRLGAERAADGEHVVEDADPDAGVPRLPPRLAVREAGREGRRDQRQHRRARVQEPGRQRRRGHVQLGRRKRDRTACRSRVSGISSRCRPWAGRPSSSRDGSGLSPFRHDANGWRTRASSAPRRRVSA